MKKEREEEMLTLITNESLTEEHEAVESKVYQSNPVKSNLYAKMLAFRQSQKKFNVQDLIQDNLK